ncbi:MAG: hypothetical protein QUT30_14645 [Acidobacteriota bacterium]|nr:hypothetical protein [Acidobacteriota bacterium]
MRNGSFLAFVAVVRLFFPAETLPFIALFPWDGLSADFDPLLLSGGATLPDLRFTFFFCANALAINFP